MSPRGIFDVGFPPACEMQQVLSCGDQVLVVLRECMPDYVMLLPAAVFKSSQFWWPRVGGLWKQNDRNDIHTTIETKTGRKKRVLRLILAYNKMSDKAEEHGKRSFTLEAGATPAKECDELAGHDYIFNDTEWHRYLNHTTQPEKEDTPCSDPVSLFHKSEEAAGFVEYEKGGLVPFGCRAHAIAVIAHKIILTYLLGRSVDTSKGDDQRSTAELFADVVALAELYDLIGVIARSISRDLRQMRGVWEDVAQHPHFYLAMAVKLKDRDLFVEALRHTAATLIPNRYMTIFKAVSNSTPLSDQDVEQLINKYYGRLRKVEENVQKIVTTHCLPSTYTKLLGDPSNTTFAQGRSNAQFYKSLVRFIFKEWFDNEWMGLSKEPMKRFSIAERLIRSASYKAGDAESILGDQIHEKIADTYSVRPANTSTEGDPDLVRNPANFSACVMQQLFHGLSEELGECLRSYEKSRIATEYFTHFDFDPQDLPWDIDELVSDTQPLILETGVESHKTTRTEGQRRGGGSRGRGRGRSR